MRLKWDKWLYGMGQAVIGGVAASGSAYIGTLIGNQITADVAVMKWQTLGFVLFTSSVTNLFFYLKQSPLPPEVTGDTETFTKPVEPKDQYDPNKKD